jgi:hypothetical protein
MEINRLPHRNLQRSNLLQASAYYQTNRHGTFKNEAFRAGATKIICSDVSFGWRWSVCSGAMFDSICPAVELWD